MKKFFIALPLILAAILARMAWITYVTPNGYMPHGYCLEWYWPLLAPMLAANVVIGVTYLAIPFLLAYYVTQRGDDDLPSWVIWSFVLFILLCGIGHWVKMSTIFVPAYWVEAVVDCLTAIVSMATLIALPIGCREMLNRPSRRAMAEALGQLRAAEGQIEALIPHLESLNSIQAGFQSAQDSLRELERKFALGAGGA